MADKFGSHQKGLDSPADVLEQVTPSNSTDLTNVTRALYCGSGGTIVCHDANGREVVFENTQAGQVLPVRVSRVRVDSAGSPTVTTSATGIVGLS